MKKEKKYIWYSDALTDNEILQYALIINQFKNNEIDFQTLKELFWNKRIKIIPSLVYPSTKKKLTISQLEELKKRFLERKYLYSDINYFILNSNKFKFKNVIFHMDYKVIELLANYGLPEYQEAMISILMNKLKHSFDKDKDFEIIAQRAKWKRRIAELKLALSKEEVTNKSR